MNKLEIIKTKIEAIEEEPTPKQVLNILCDVVDLFEEKQVIGFKTKKG